MAKKAYAKRGYKRRRKTMVRISRPAIRRVVNSMNERKFLDNTTASFLVASAQWGFESTLRNLTQGSSANQRLGNAIYLTKIEWCITATLTATAAAGARAKFIVYHNKEAVGTVPTYSMLFNTNDLLSLRNTATQPRISIMKTREASFVVTTALPTYGPNVCINIAVYPKKKIVFQGNTNSIADVLKDDYGLAWCASQANVLTYGWNTKMTFTDA